MTKLEKIKMFIIYKDLKILSYQDRLNTQGLVTLMDLEIEFENYNVENCLDDLEEIFENETRRTNKNDRDANE